jgi:solute carrier family 25 (mitochondrial phosphate transporter), member 23/24/25/41
MASGAAASSATTLALYPLDTLIRRQQLNGALGQRQAFRGIAMDMVRNEGLTSFYRGVLPGLLRVVPAAAVQFAAYDVIRSGVQALDPTATVAGL